ncbi:MAG: hypothetical protein DRI57_19170, partial [Deltaproteobacteria bacterium]
NFYASGTYKVAVYVMDTEGNVSPCKKTSIYYQSAGSEIHPDDYEGIGYVKAWNYLNVFGEGTAYSLKIYTPTGPSRVNFTVKITDFITEAPIEGAEVKIIDAGDVPVENIDSEPSCRSLKNGACHLNFLKANDIGIAVSASGYMPESAKISIRMTDEGKIMKEFRLKPYHSADYNPPDCKVTLSELLRVIQLYNKGAYHCDPDGEEDKYAPG